MTAVSGLTGAVLLGVPDPRVPAAVLSAMDSSAARRVAEQISTAAAAMGSSATHGAPSIADLARGWSNPLARLGVSRLLWTAEQTAGILQGQATAIEALCSTIDRAKSNGALDMTLALAEIHALQRTTVTDLLGAAVGVPSAVDAVRLTGIVRRLFERLTGRIETVNAALVTLASQLAGCDPTVGPDALRAGDQAVLPPDPMRNPAHRTDRDNRALLAADLHSDDPARIRFAMSILESLQRAGDRTGVVQLVVYDSAAFRGQGRAAISVGDLTTAANVAVVVPGITNSPSSMSGGLDLAADLREEADRQAPKEQTAVVAWYGYDIPASWTKDPGTSISTDVADTIAAGSAANAASGAPVLASDLSKIKAMSQTSERISLLGFSMGSTTVSEAAQFTLPVDSVVLMGSPGAGWNTETASGYRNVPESEVFVLSYDQDPVTLPVTDHLASDALGLQSPFGPDPAANTFGGKHIDVDSNVPLVTAAGLIPSILRIAGDPRHHSMKNYMEGRALAAEGAIVVGRTDRVPTKRGR